jgi:divalent metal cation (Fe/Co/Zn/Cd) transporter
MQRTEWRERFALRVSFWANVVLLAVKLFAAFSSGSLSIITSALDSFLDLVSGMGAYENKHWTDVESTNRVRVSA